MSDIIKKDETVNAQNEDVKKLEGVLKDMPKIKEAARLMKEAGIDTTDIDSIVADVENAGVNVLNIVKKVRK